MSVLYVVVRAPGDGVYGGEKSTIVAAQGRAERGGGVHFLVAGCDGLLEALDEARLPYDTLPHFDPLFGLRQASPFEKARRVLRLAQLNREVFRASRRTRATWVHVSGAPAVYAVCLGARLAGARLLFHIRDTSRAGRLRWYEALAMLLSDRSVAVSHSLRQVLLETAPAALRARLGARLCVVYNGFHFEAMDAHMRAHSRAECRGRLGVPESVRLAVLVGALGEKKGQLWLVEQVLHEAVRRASGLTLVFVGGEREAGYEARCRAAAQRLGLREHVRFAGYQSQRATYDWYRAADLAVCASEREGLSRFAVEAQAFGLPVVTRDIPGPVDVVLHNSTGYVVGRNDTAALAHALGVLASDPELCGRLGARGARSVRERFVFERHLDELETVYGERSVSAHRAPAGV